jgi:hypothetical protein
VHPIDVEVAMFLLELLTWIGVSLALVMFHIGLSKGRHPRLLLTLATGAMFGCVGGLVGTMLRLRSFERGQYSALSLILAIAAALAYLFVEWAGSHQHPVGRYGRRV